MRKRAAVIVAVSLALGLSACSSNSTSYADAQDLKAAWLKAGGSCDSGSTIPAAMVSKGADSILCGPGVNVLTVFDTKDEADSYVDKISDTLDEQQLVRGDTWTVASKSAEKYASDLGGKAVK